MRIIVCDCSAEYTGRLNTHLDRAKRVLLIKDDHSVLIFSEIGSYKPLNWMVAPCSLVETSVVRGTDRSNDGYSDDSTSVFNGDSNDGCTDGSSTSTTAAVDYPERVLRVIAKKSPDVLTISLWQVISDESYELGDDAGLVKDGVEDHLQRYLAEQIERIGEGARLITREYQTPIGPVDILAINAQGEHVAIEIKRHGGIDGVEQLTRYCELLNRDPLLAPVHGIFAAQTIAPQARTLARDRGFTCLILDYDDMKGTDSNDLRLF